MSAPDLYSWWRDALNGKPVDSEVGRPRAGFWKASNHEPIAIWYGDDGEPRCERTKYDGSLMKANEIDDLYASASRYPITEDTYRAAFDGNPPDGFKTRLSIKEIQANAVWSLALGVEKARVEREKAARKAA